MGRVIGGESRARRIMTVPFVLADTGSSCKLVWSRTFLWYQIYLRLKDVGCKVVTYQYYLVQSHLNLYQMLDSNIAAAQCINMTLLLSTFLRNATNSGSISKLYLPARPGSMPAVRYISLKLCCNLFRLLQVRILGPPGKTLSTMHFGSQESLASLPSSSP
jgi:hypothetical protein